MARETANWSKRITAKEANIDRDDEIKINKLKGGAYINVKWNDWKEKKRSSCIRSKSRKLNRA